VRPPSRFLRLAGFAIVALVLSATLLAHEVIVRGTVAAIEKTRVQIKTGEEKPDQAPQWYPIDSETRIKRGEKIVTFDSARIKVNERAVIILDHPDRGPIRTKEIRLAPETD
jgi:hypothetical protein